MTENNDEEPRVLGDEVKSFSLLKAILPINVILETQNTVMATHFSKSPQCALKKSLEQQFCDLSLLSVHRLFLRHLLFELKIFLCGP